MEDTGKREACDADQARAVEQNLATWVARHGPCGLPSSTVSLTANFSCTSQCHLQPAPPLHITASPTANANTACFSRPPLSPREAINDPPLSQTKLAVGHPLFRVATATPPVSHNPPQARLESKPTVSQRELAVGHLLARTVVVVINLVLVARVLLAALAERLAGRLRVCSGHEGLQIARNALCRVLKGQAGINS